MDRQGFCAVASPPAVMHLKAWWRSSVGGLPGAFWTIWVGTLIDRLGCFVVPFLALYLTGERGLSVAQAGFIVSLHGAGGMGAGLLGGALADRIGRRRTALGALVAGACGVLLLAVARQLWAIGALAFSVGLLYGMYRPAVSAMIADLVPVADRQRAFNHMYWAINLGISISLIAAGYLSRLGFALLFVADASTTMLFALVLAARVPETRPARPSGAARGMLAGLRVPLTDLVFLPFAGLSFLLGCIFSQWASTLPLSMRLHGLAPSQFGTLMAINGVMIVVLQPVAPLALARLGRSRGLALAALFVGCGFGLTAWAAGPAVYAVSIAVWTLGEICNAPLAPTIVADLSPPHLRGSYQGVQSASWGLATFVGPAVGGLVLERAGSALWLGCAAVGLLVAFGHLAVAPARRRRLRAQAATTDAREPVTGPLPAMAD
jgi:MFS family permease